MGIGVLIMKIVAAVILFIAFVVGTHAHYESYGNSDSSLKKGMKDCRELNEMTKSKTQKQVVQNGTNDEFIECPVYAAPMELVVIYIFAILFIVSVVMIIVGLVGGSRMKTCDGVYSGIAGVLIMTCGILLIVAAVQNNKFVRQFLPKKLNDQDKNLLEKMEKAGKYQNKLGAGALGIIDGIFYCVVSFFIFYSRDE